MMQPRIKVLTLTDAVFPWTGLLRDVLLVAGFTFFLALCARIAIYLPFTPVPITGQTLGVLLTGALLGSRRGALALVLYLAEGLAGLPVFAAGNSAWSPTRIPGVPYILGPTAGYMVGFVPAAYVVGYLTERGWDRRLWTAALAMLIGNIVIYIPGILWLRFGGFVPGLPLVIAGLLPYIPGDLVKLAIAAVVLPSGWAALQRWQR